MRVLYAVDREDELVLRKDLRLDPVVKAVDCVVKISTYGLIVVTLDLCESLQSLKVLTIQHV